MKQLLALVCFASIAIGYAAREPFKTGINGTVDPGDGASKIWAINGTDTFSTLPVNGKFAIDTRPGNWLLVLDGIAPYKTTAVNSVLVLDNQSTDVGVVKMNR